MLRAMNWVLCTLIAGSLVFAGCSKSNQSDYRLPATMDLAKFQQAFPAPSPSQQDNISKVSEGVRYGMYPQALAALEKLAAEPALTEPQKKAVKDLGDGIKETMAKAAAPAAK